MNNNTPDLFLHRFQEDDIRFDNETPSTDLQDDGLPLDKILEALGGILDNADQSLSELSEQDGVLGSAIVRGCQDLANAVGHIAGELERQSDDQRRALAEACLEDAKESTRQIEAAQSTLEPSSSPQTEELALMSADELVSALAGVSPLLRDVEAGLRGIEQSEADEIADVALTLARLFVASLQSFHSSVVQKEEEKRQLESDRFELLEDDDDDENNNNETGNDSNQSSTRRRSSRQQKRRNDRLRVLWPPIGPAVASACSWGKDEAVRQPILAVALGMTLWPAAVATAFLGAPLVAADALVQHAYESFQDGPIVSNVEKSAAQLYQAGKLSLLCGKLVTRQSLRVINRQIERNGGIGPVVQNLAGMAVDKALHPVETVTEVWGRLNWVWDVVQDNLKQLNHFHGGDSERRDASAADDGWQ